VIEHYLGTEFCKYVHIKFDKKEEKHWGAPLKVDSKLRNKKK